MRAVVIADDFTGALDTATQFAKLGAGTAVYTVSTERMLQDVDGSVPIIVLNAESRHLDPAAAYRHVHTLARWALAQQPYIVYKKTDSALRGNIGSELQALADAYGAAAQVHFLPAYPQNGRTTHNGVHYYYGVAISQSVFGKDPFEPVTTSSIEEILAQQTAMQCVVVRKDGPSEKEQKPCISIYDSETDADIQAACIYLKEFVQTPLLLAGCAGFAEHIARLLLADIPQRKAEELPRAKRLLIISGSLNAITMQQLQYAKDRGVAAFPLHGKVELQKGYTDTPSCSILEDQVKKALQDKRIAILNTAGVESAQDNALAERFVDVSQAIALLAERVYADCEQCAMAVFGGDTLQAIVNRLFPCGILPQGEIQTGVPVCCALGKSGCKSILITKSGGFGTLDIVQKIIDYLNLEA